MQSPTFVDPPNPGAWNVLTGRNGSGKSRYLGYLAERVGEYGKYSKTICLSGTVFERFPKMFYESDRDSGLVYLGHKTNNNMFSTISPFRRLILQVLISDDVAAARYSAARDLLNDLGFEDRMRIRFRQGRSAKDKSGESRPRDVTVYFASPSLAATDFENDVVANLTGGKIHVSDVQFFKGADELSLNDLSSGERGYILAGLAFCFCATDNSLVLFDEPENSLHPEWQSRIIQDLDRVLERTRSAATIVVATHSPLIAASVPNRNGYICDLEAERPSWRKLGIFGMNADNVLSEQFGLRSARSAQAIDTIQRCLTLIANGMEFSAEFSTAGQDFSKLSLRLSDNDPLFETVQTIRTFINGGS